MRGQTARMLVLCTLFLFAGLAWGQSGSPVVYVSGTGGVILSVNTTTGATTTLVSNPNAAYEGLVVGPDNAASDNTSTTNHPYLLYACDPTHNTIIRFDPNNVAAGIETVYAGTGAAGTLTQPQCGRFTNTRSQAGLTEIGDLIVSSKAAGSGIWKIAGAANIALGAGGFPVPTQNPPNGAVPSPPSPLPQVSQGVAQKNIGDLLIVDSANKEVIRSQYATIPPFSAPPTVFIKPSSLLPGPLGIVRKSGGDIYISNQAKNANSIVHFNAQGASGSTCVSFSNNTAPFFMQMSADDTLYVATSSANSGALFSVNTGKCPVKATQVNTSSTLPPLVGVALPPTTVTQTATFSGTQTFNFGFAVYQFTSPSCTLSVQAVPTNLAVINALILPLIQSGTLPNGTSPAVNLGWDGFEIGFNLTPPDSCTKPFSDGYGQLLGAQVDNLLVSNPRILACDASCSVITSYGDYPLGGLLPADGTYSGHGFTSEHFLVNAGLNTSEPGTFCGLESPFTVPNVPPPGISGTFSSGQAISVKFKLAAGANQPGNCQNGPFITDAIALLSVAQIFDANGNAVFNPIAIGSSGSSTPTPPTFKVDSNKQYQFSLSLQGYASGTYSLTVTFLTSNTSYQVVEFQVL